MLGKTIAQLVVGHTVAIGVGKVVGEVAAAAMPQGMKIGAKIMYTIGVGAIAWYASDKIGNYASDLVGRSVELGTEIADSVVTR